MLEKHRRGSRREKWEYWRGRYRFKAKGLPQPYRGDERQRAKRELWQLAEAFGIAEGR